MTGTPPGSAVPQSSATSYFVNIQQYLDGFTNLGRTENKIGIDGWTKLLLKINSKNEH